MNFTPHPYQKAGIQLLAREAAAGLLLDPGMGKTSIALAAFKVLKRAGVVERLLVIAPQRPARLVWRQESEKWEFGLTFAPALGTAAERAAALASDADVYVINPENAPWLAEGLATSNVSIRADMLVVDESTRFKNSAGVRFKALKQLLPHFKRRYILTGTPMPNRLEDLFAQCYIMDGGAALGRFVTGFRKTYMTPVYRPGVPVALWEPQRGAEERVYRKLNGKVLRLSAADYLTMPERIDNVIRVELGGAAQKQYAAMEKDFFAQIDAGIVTAANAAAATMKLRQMANGVAYLNIGVTGVVHDAKIEALRSLIEEQSGQPLLVAVSFLSEVPAIREALGYNVPYLGGGVSTAESERIVAGWNRGEIPVLLAHPTSVAHGLNLQAGGHAVCWFGLTWAMEEYIQFNARVWRQGQKRSVVIHHIVAQDTIDELMMRRLADKHAAQERLFDALKRSLSDA